MNKPSQIDGNMVNRGIGVASKTMAPMESFYYPISVASMDGMNRVIHQRETWGMMNPPSGGGFYPEIEDKELGGGGGIYDGMALPDHILGQYYTRVRTHLNIIF